MPKQANDITSESLLYWTEVLTGLDQGQVAQAREEVASWGLSHVDAELLDDTVDAAAGATMLIESMNKLALRGVPPERVIKKLRQEPAVWPTWGEIRVAEILLMWADDEAELRLEEGRSKGTHADFRIILPNEQAGTSVEVKSVGLSDDEVDFCQRMMPALPRAVPKMGLGHIHAPMDAKPPRMNREERRMAERDARKGMKKVPNYPMGLRGASIVGHGSEDRYALRVSRRVEQAVRQLPVHDDCWVAILWSNGAPVAEVAKTIRWDQIPLHINGVFLLGSGVAFPDRHIHNYVVPIPRDLPSHAETDLQTLDEVEGMEALAAVILKQFERSSGVRATLVYGGAREILKRDGSKRIYPFNFLLTPDPPFADREAGEFWRP